MCVCVCVNIMFTLCHIWVHEMYHKHKEVHADKLVKADGKGQGSDPFLFCLAHKEKSSYSKAGLKLIMNFNNIRNSMEEGSQRLNSLTPDQPERLQRG